VPRSLRAAFSRAAAVADTGTATIEQLAFADFVGGGHLERHLRRTRVKNAARREALLGAARKHFRAPGLVRSGSDMRPCARVEGADAGVHVIVWLDDVPASQAAAIRRACRERGVAIYPIGSYYKTRPPQAGFLLGYASLRPDVIEEGIRILAEVVKDRVGVSVEPGKPSARSRTARSLVR
jgi:GntR family transcriptional regulator/MocR family aminotransferase